MASCGCQLEFQFGKYNAVRNRLCNPDEVTSIQQVYAFSTMTIKIFTLSTLSIVFALASLAADVTGKWIAQVPGRDNQTREVVYNFKAEGAKLSGTMSGPQGAEIAISDGKIEGDAIAFSVKLEFNGNSMVRNYSGVVSGDEIKMKSQTQRGALEFVAKRSK